MHTTNYINTFSEIAEDYATQTAEIPPQKGDKQTATNVQFDMKMAHPYRFTSEDVLFHVFATKNNKTDNLSSERELFFSKGQPCFRASPLQNGVIGVCTVMQKEKLRFILPNPMNISSF